MKTAYELAMERLGKTAPTVKVTAGQKKRLAELDSQYAAKTAERELALKDEIARVAAAGDFEKVETWSSNWLTNARSSRPSWRKKGAGAPRCRSLNGQFCNV